MKNNAYEKVRVTAAVVDKSKLTLYKEDGTTIFVPQGDPNLRRILEEITPQLLDQNLAEVYLVPPPENSYANFEKESSGVVRFFKIAKQKLKELISDQEAKPADTRPVNEMSLGHVPTPPAAQQVLTLANKPMVAIPVTKMAAVPASLVSAAAEASEQYGDDELERFRDEQEAKVQKVVEENTWPFPDPPKTPANEDLSGVYANTEVREGIPEVTIVKLEEPTVAVDAVNEILAHAMPVGDIDFSESGVGKQGAIANEKGHTANSLEEGDAPETIIAVVDNKIIPGMEKIKSQFSRAVKLGSTVGVENFLKRLAAVIDQRAHSIDELLNFLERADLPIADDGSILIYKVLNHKEKDKHTYVDCHSGKVEQWVGAYVCMDPNMVDMNRRQECSVGLHVARRGYVRSFSGTVCVLGKLAPEDVIAVPYNEANKLRACGYHLIAELTPEQYKLVKQNKPISDDPAGKLLLADAIAGRHTRITHRVEIRGPLGADVITTAVGEGEAPVHQVPEAKPVVEAEALPNEESSTKDDPVDPVGVAKVVTQVIEQKQLSRKEQAAALYAEYLEGKQGASAALQAFKKVAKVGWDKLGITDPEFTKLTGEGKPIMGKIDRKKEPNRGSIRKAEKKAAAKIQFLEGVKAPNPFKEKEESMDAAKPTGNFPKAPIIGKPKEEGSPRQRIEKLLAGGLTSPEVAKAILDIKKKSKKSWSVLGVSIEDQNAIRKLVEGK